MRELCIEDLYEIINKLEAKINILTDHIKGLPKSKMDYQPNQTIQEWLEKSNVSSNNIHKLFTTEDGTVNAFKDFIVYNNKNDKIPISLDGKKLNLFCEEDCVKKWKRCDDDNLNKFITEIWRKFLEFYTKMPIDNSINEDIMFLQKQKVLQMRSQLCDVEKTKKRILKWLTEIV